MAKNTLGHEWNCSNCCYFIPNGSPLGIGYCIANKYAYRKKGQTCDNFNPRTFIVMECINQGWTVEQISQEFGLRPDLVAEEIERRTKQ